METDSVTPVPLSMLHFTIKDKKKKPRVIGKLKQAVDPRRIVLGTLTSYELNMLVSCTTPVPKLLGMSLRAFSWLISPGGKYLQSITGSKKQLNF